MTLTSRETGTPLVSVIITGCKKAKDREAVQPDFASNLMLSLWGFHGKPARIRSRNGILEIALFWT